MRSILTRRPTAGPSRATLPAPPAVQLPSNSPPAKSPSLFPRHTINFQIPLASNAPAASPRAQPRASTSGAKPLAATATTATAAEPRIESANPKEKTKKRRSHRPAKDPAPAPLDDEMQEVADALQGVMDVRFALLLGTVAVLKTFCLLAASLEAAPGPPLVRCHQLRRVPRGHPRQGREAHGDPPWREVRTYYHKPGRIR